MSGAAFVILVAALLIVPLAWAGALAGLRALTTRGAVLERGELSLLVMMLAPVLIGVLCLAWAAAPVPYVPSPVLAEIMPFEAHPASRAGEAIAMAPSFDWLGAGALLLSLVYALGFAWRALRLGVAQMRVARIAARAVDASSVWGADVALTNARVSAFLAMDGKIIVPRVLVEALTPAQIMLIIAHERSHHARGDAVLFAALAWIDAVCWFNPFVRAQTARCRLAAELACDAAAASDAPDMRKAYAQTLVAALKLGALEHPAGSALQCAPAVFSTGIMGDHRMRIERIMGEGPQARKRVMWGVYAAVVVLAAPLALLQAAIAQPSVGQSVRASVTPLVVAQQSAVSASANSTFRIVPVAGRISSRFGDQRDPSTGVPPTHTGMDFAAPTGTEIVAPGAGVVRIADWMGRYGKLIEIDHGGGLVTRYAHLDAYEVSVGQTVAAGQLIGRVGATGMPGLEPHLHFEVWRDGVKIDPESALPSSN
jgi:Zn-dependent protease with chaperone function